LIEEDAKKPKIERQFSFYNLKLKEQNELLEQVNDELLEKNKSIERINKSSEGLLKINIDLTSKNKELTSKHSALENKIDALSERFDLMIERLKDIASAVSVFVVDLMTKNNAQKSRYDIEAKQNDFFKQFETYAPINQTLEEMAETADDYKIKNELRGLKKP